MRWPDVWQAMVAAMQAREEITDVMRSAIYLEGPRTFRIEADANRGFEVPSLTGMLLGDTEVELWDIMEFQLDIWTRTLPQAIAVERVVRWLFHHDTRVTIQGVHMWMEFVVGRTVTGPGRDRYFGRSLDFRATPIRQRYVRAAES